MGAVLTPRERRRHEELFPSQEPLFVFVLAEGGTIISRNLAGNILVELPSDGSDSYSLGDLRDAVWVNCGRLARFVHGSSEKLLEGSDAHSLLDAMSDGDVASS